jgi:hypothetical protein
VADSKRLTILNAIKARLAAINGVGVFVTDAGDRIFTGVLPQLGPDDAYPCLVVYAADDSVGNQQSRVMLSLPVEIAVVVPVDALAKDEWDRVEAALADVKRAIELPDRTLGNRLVQDRLRRGSTRMLDRDPGSTVAGVVIRYELPYYEEWGEP